MYSFSLGCIHSVSVCPHFDNFKQYSNVKIYLLNDIILYHEGNIVLLYLIIEILDLFISSVNILRCDVGM